MAPLVACAITFGVGCVIGGITSPLVGVAVRLAAAAGIALGLALRLALTGRERLAYGAMLTGTLVAGVAAGATAESMAWQPRGPDVAVLATASTRLETVRVSGRLARDAWVTPSGAVALDVLVDRVTVDATSHVTSMGVRLSVGGERGQAALPAWTRGRRVSAPVQLRRPLPYANFGVSDTERTLARQGLRLFGSIKSASLVEVTPAPWWEEHAAAARARVRTAVAAHVSDPTAAATVTAILVGDRSRLAPDVVTRLQHAGVYHVVAISGGNVGIWLALVLWVPRVAGAGPKWVAVVLGVGLAAFAAVVDGGPSVARASTVAAVAIGARWWDVRVRAWQALAVAALVQMVGDPHVIHDPGALLSFGAAGALVIVGAAWSPTPTLSPWRRATRALMVVLLATMAVELAVLPVAARWFHVVTAAGLLSNVLALPAMAVVQIAGLALVPLATIAPPAADLAGRVAALGVAVLMRSADVVTLAPWLVRDVPPPSTAVLSAYYGALGLATIACRHRRLDLAIAPVVLTVGALAWIVTGGRAHDTPAPWTWPAAARWQRVTWPAEGWLLITVLDVGQGDATVVRWPSGATWLVDAGGSVSETFDLGARVTVPALWALGHRRLDRVLVTHAHPDHAAGVPAVIRRFRPREVHGAVPVAGDARQAAIETAAADVGAPVRWLSRGERLGRDLVRATVVHPERPDWERRRVRNDDSLALWVRFGDVGVLLPGDISAASEMDALRHVEAAPVTIVRLAHHGSASSTGAALIDTLQPALALASAGRGNVFGHPSTVVVQRLAQAGVPLLRTDEHGAIQVATNGRVVLVRTAAGLSGTITPGPPRRAWWLATRPPSDRASPGPAAGRRPRGAIRPP